MTQQQFINFYKGYKPGSYTRLTNEKITGDYKKVTSMVIRFINYYHIKAVAERGNIEPKPRPYEVQLIPHILKLNTNTNNLLLCVYNTNHHKTTSLYYYKDQQITAAEYYAASGDKLTNNNSVVYSIKLNDVVTIGR